MFGVYEKEEEGVYEEGVGAGQWPEGALTRSAATHDAMHRYSKLQHTQLGKRHISDPHFCIASPFSSVVQPSKESGKCGVYLSQCRTVYAAMH